MAVRAAGLNGADRLQVAGFYPAPPGSPPDIPGHGARGRGARARPRHEPVRRRATGSWRWSGAAAQAERAVVHERHLLPVPDGVAWPEAGGFPEVYTTAFDALFTQCGLGVGESVLVHGAAGGVGMAGVQLAVAAGARVVATVRDPERRAEVAALTGAVGDRSGGLRSPRSLRRRAGARRCSQPRRRPPGARHRRPHLGHRGRRRRPGRREPPRAHGQAGPHPRLDPSRPVARGEGHGRAARWSAMCSRCSPPAPSACPCTPPCPWPMPATAYAQFAAGGKLGKIVLVRSARPPDAQ